MNNLDEKEAHVVRRLTELEIKAAFAEDLVDQLNEIVIRQQTQLDTLARELAALKQLMPSGDTVQVRSLRDELPPHY